MAIDTKEKRAGVLGVGRPWLRDKFPVATPDEQWRIDSGNAYGGNALSPPDIPAGFISVTLVAEKMAVTFTDGENMGCVTKMNTKACEKGSYGITASFVDELGGTMTPDSLTWTLSRMDGTIVNSREDVAVAVPAASVTVTMSGNDLAIFTDDNRRRRFTLEGTFTSDLGSGIPFKAEAEFVITDLVNVS